MPCDDNNNNNNNKDNDYDSTSSISRVWRFDAADGLLRLDAFPFLCVAVERPGPPRNYLRLKLQSCGDGGGGGGSGSSGGATKLGDKDGDARLPAAVLRFSAGRVSRCGVKGTGSKRKRPKLRIMGGRPADESMHPWQVHIRIQARVSDSLRKKTFGGR